MDRNSSFHMGDEFNGNGEIVYLEASSHNVYAPLSQRDVRKTPDFSQCTLKALGAMPLLSSAKEKDNSFMCKALGALTDVGRVIIRRDTCTNRYQADFKIHKIRLTNGSYLHKSKRHRKGS